MTGRPEGDRPWHARYPAGVPTDIDPAELPTLADLFEECVAQFPDRVAFETFGKSITYREFEKNVRDLASALQQMALKKGDAVAVMMPNLLAYPVVTFALVISGYTVVNINPLYTPRELEHQLKDSGAEAIVILENFATTLEQVLPKVPLMPHQF